jgi:antitoxin component of MazEF toxin-antitoxin module
MTSISDFSKRRILAANYSRYISLPKDWLWNWYLNRGDEITLGLNEDGILLITPKKEEEREE